MVASVRHVISNMSGANDVASLIYACRQAQNARQPLHLVLSGTRGIYPNGAVPMAACLQYFKLRGLRITDSDVCPEVSRTYFLNSRRASPAELKQGNIKNIVWRYSDEKEATALCGAFIEELAEDIECGPGVLDALNWCLFEVMDNVFQHSHAEVGYTMLQIHYNSKRCVVAVADHGIGIYGHSAKPAFTASITNTKR